MYRSVRSYDPRQATVPRIGGGNNIKSCFGPIWRASLPRLEIASHFVAVPVLDCTDALAFLSRNREKYGLDTDRTIVLGSSAVGHLASLIGTNLTSDHTRFISDPSQPMAKIRGVVDFYGPTDLVILQSKRGEIDFQNDPSPEARFLGHSPLMRPDLARDAFSGHLCQRELTTVLDLSR